MIWSWLLTALASLVAMVLVGGSCLTRFEAAYNRIQDGWRNAAAVGFDLLMALVAPAVFLMAMRLGRTKQPTLESYQSACGYGSMVGMVVLFLGAS